MKIDESWFVRPKNSNFPTSVGAGGVVVRKNSGKLLIALINNNSYKDYLLPKGKQEDGEEIEQTAKREIAEETGLLNLKFVCKLGVKERLSFEKDVWKIIHYFLYQTDDVAGKQNLERGEEDLKLTWFDLDNLLALFWPEQKEIIEKNRKRIKKLFS